MFLRHVREVREREENEDEDPPAKITRLAIGVEGGFDASKEQYEYTVSRLDNFYRVALLDLESLDTVFRAPIIKYEQFKLDHRDRLLSPGAARVRR